ncbi:MAG: hypothetical protein KA797_01275 [Chitinophagales bacterium]|nr:hypothetical protein [Chitinophagales bacterium]
MKFKEAVFAYYRNLLEDKIQFLENSLEELKGMGANESKSTAGDKHETALAMLQIEQERLRNQLQIAIQELQNFTQIPTDLVTEKIGLGSLIKSNGTYYFLSSALGKAEIMGNKVIALSKQSPLGGQLFGKRLNDFAELNGMKYPIEAIQ